MKGPVLGRLATGEPVEDRPNSHLHREVIPLLEEALRRIRPQGNFFVAEVDFGRIIGQTICVPTEPGDKILFAVRLLPNGRPRAGHTRFVLNRRPAPTGHVVCVLNKADSGRGPWVLITAFTGRKPEVEPWDPRADEKARSFWARHALVWGSEPVLPGSVTELCPW